MQRVTWSVALAMWVGLSLMVAPVPLARQSGACDDVRDQIDATQNDLDQLQNDSTPLLAQTQQLVAVVPGDAFQAAVAGTSPILTPQTAGTYAAPSRHAGATPKGALGGDHQARVRRTSQPRE